MSFPPHPAEKIILALDGMSKEESLLLVSKIPKLCWVKVGLELFVRAGPELISVLRDKGKRVFLDLKFHDIPSTMSKACRQAAMTGAELITVHACAGRKALVAARNGAMQGAIESDFPSPTLLAVTVLTSWTPDDIAEDLLIDQPLNERVLTLAQLALSSGIGGCICSPMEVKKMRQLLPEHFELITPGIRLKGEDLNDQKRVMTPSDAISSGASKIVIGRSISRSNSPCLTFEEICHELSPR
tara:strand:+ start:2131 stop:2859 length:729 start_codon:yes stop_codon:yes gene_type:complete